MPAREAGPYVVSLGSTGSLEEKVDLILENQKRETHKRKLALWWAVGGALFAAGRLGILAVPLVKARRANRK